MALDVEFLKSLCLAPGPSGFPGRVQDVVRARVEGIATVDGDPLGNVWADVNPSGSPHVLVVAHSDQIGLIVTHVDERGFVYYDAIGIMDPQLLPGHDLVIHAKEGPVRGVVGRPPTHIIPEAERGKAPPLNEQFVDIGARSQEAALERVAVGDPITFAPHFFELSPDIYASLAFDNRAGVYCALSALELYAESAGKARLTVASSTHEETLTYMGAKALVQRFQPDCTIVVDGEYTSDYPGVDAKRIGGDHRLGGGPVLARGSAGNEILFAMASAVAAEEAIPTQVRAFGGCWVTDGDELAAAGATATLSLAFPMRYVHSPFEVVCGADLDALAKLLDGLARHLGEVFKPGCFVPRS
jgi:putative aminopeptidase FrvX